MYWFTDLSPKRTGLPFVIWVSPRMGARHGMRVKVSPTVVTTPPEMDYGGIGTRFRVLRGEMTCRDLALLRQWVEMNRDVLVKHWNGETDSMDVIEAVRPIKL